MTITSQTATHASSAEGAREGRAAATLRGRRASMLLGSALPPLLAVVVILVGWELYVGLAGVSRQVLPSPSAVVAAGWDQRSALIENAVPTLQATGLGLALSIVASWIIASACDLSSPIRRAIEPLLVASQTIPVVAIAPLLILWFGFSIFPKILLVALTTFFPIVISLLQGMGSTSSDATRLLRSMGATRLQRFVRVRVPTALPYFFTGLKISIVYAITGAIFGEYVGAQSGLGIYMQLARNARRTDLILAAVAITAILSLILYLVVVMLERAALPWQRFAAQGADR